MYLNMKLLKIFVALFLFVSSLLIPLIYFKDNVAVEIIFYMISILSLGWLILIIKTKKKQKSNNEEKNI